MKRLAAALALAVAVLAGCAEAPAQSPAALAAPAATTAAETPAAPTTRRSAVDIGNDELMAQELYEYVPRGFNSVGYGRNVCVKLRQGFSFQELRDGMMTLGLSQDSAKQFVTTATLIYCREYRTSVPEHSTW
jgi:hypothetical protein